MTIVDLAPGETNHRYGEKRATCTACQRTNLHLSVGSNEPLWLSVDTRHGRFYAWNYEHLDYIEAYVRATLRKVVFKPAGIRNSSVTSRLPLWVKQTKNRAEVLKIIARLRRKKAPKP